MWKGWIFHCELCLRELSEIRDRDAGISLVDDEKLPALGLDGGLNFEAKYKAGIDWVLEPRDLESELDPARELGWCDA